MKKLAEESWRTDLYDKATTVVNLQLDAPLLENYLWFLRRGPKEHPERTARDLLALCRCSFNDRSFKDLDQEKEEEYQIEEMLNEIYNPHDDPLKSPIHPMRIVVEILKDIRQLTLGNVYKFKLFALIAVRIYVPYEKSRAIQVTDEILQKSTKGSNDEYIISNISKDIEEASGIFAEVIQLPLIRIATQIQIDFSTFTFDLGALLMKISNGPQKESYKEVNGILTKGGGEQFMAVINFIYSKERPEELRIRLVVIAIIYSYGPTSKVRGRQCFMLLMDEFKKHKIAPFGSLKYCKHLAFGLAKLMKSLKVNNKMNPEVITEWKISTSEYDHVNK